MNKKITAFLLLLSCMAMVKSDPTKERLLALEEKDVRGNTPFMEDAKCGNFGAVKTTYERFYIDLDTLNNNYKTALDLAHNGCNDCSELGKKREYVKVIQYLKSKKVEELTKLLKMQEKFPEKAYLKDLGVPDTLGHTLFMVGARSGSVEMMRGYYDQYYNIDLNDQSRKGETAMDLASSGNHKQAMKYLMMKIAQEYVRQAKMKKSGA